MKRIQEEWGERNELSLRSLNALFENDLACIRIKNFISPGKCSILSDRLEGQGTFNVYAGHSSNSGLSKLGPIQCEFPFSLRESYFQKAKASYEALSDLRLPFCPLTEVFTALSEVVRHGGVEIAQDPTYGRYFAGAFHRMKDVGMLLHMDFAPFDAIHWTIDAVVSQISWVLHLRSPIQGGNTEIFNRPWCLEDESRFRAPRSYHYQDGVIKGASCYLTEFEVGDLVLFNSRNYHRVQGCEGVRTTVGSFLGKLPHGQLVLWS